MSSSFPSFKLQYSLIRIICLLFMLASSTYVSAAGDPLVRTSSSFFRSLYSFGDSFVDPGNNNFIATRARSNFPPYGRDFFNRLATGRFSNGLLFPDFLAYYLGDKELQQPYLDPKLSLQWPLAAVSFASATSGFDPLTSNFTFPIYKDFTGAGSISQNAISMAKQLEYFEEYKSKLKRRFGKRKAESQIERALFYINAGSDDIAFSFFGDGTSGPRGTSPLPDYEHFLLEQVQQFIQVLTPTQVLLQHMKLVPKTSNVFSQIIIIRVLKLGFVTLQGLSDQGARRFAVSGLPPLGCIPVAITRLPRNSSLQRNCLGYVNSISEEFNELLQVALKATQSKLSKLGTKIAYIDFNQPLLDLIQNPGYYGQYIQLFQATTTTKNSYATLL
ncbi:GDSL esterase/lipase At5g45960-like [Diospyros lotus]|uniref:GDSL esterase/lipase At5g45960-like n=1 Tax=Diospyros lotus TaxID=55363 RepID=UPI002250BEA7|nr:GDSL esterase/lipase At5g45960-like [Diospyros lotus]